MVGHVAPEAAVGGPIALVEEGDLITIDADERAARAGRAARTSWRGGATPGRPPPPRYTAGVLHKYARQVSSASLGAVTDL